MSLPSFSTQGQLFSTASLSSGLFAETDRYRLFAQVIYPVLAAARCRLESCYCAENGRVAVEPVLLLGVSILQYLDGQPDRQAVDMLRYHAGWNFALNRQLGDELFHPTTLVNFRQRLVEHEQSAMAFAMILDALVQAGLIARQNRQRLDSTHVFGRVSRMSRLDCVRESLRLTLQELESRLAPPERPSFWLELWERYVETQMDYRAGSETLARKLVEAGQDAARLLHWMQSQCDGGSSKGPQLLLLERVLNEQFEVVPGQMPTPRDKGQLSSARVQNPHDPDATYAFKGQGANQREHVGYKVQVAETVNLAELAKGEPTSNFVTGIVTHAAYESDEAGSQQMDKEQGALGLEKPAVQYVDSAYVSAEKLAQIQIEGRSLIGPAADAPTQKGRFNSEAFEVQIEQRKAVCPAGKENTQCSRLEEKETGKVSYRFEWSTHCSDCALRERCLGKEQRHRTLVVGEHHTVLQARRREQKTEAFAKEFKHRAAIEGTQSELVRAHGLRRARYRGLAKTRLQNYFIGTACNVKRWIRRKLWEMTALQAGASVAG